jgi:Ca2+-dependent lipid-binding protein
MGELYSGVLKVRVVKGCKLPIKDRIMSSDPYVLIKLGKQKHQTRVIKKSLNPRWDEELKFHIMNISRSDRCSLTAEVWDHDTLSRDDFMGLAEIDLKPLLQELHPMAKGKKVVAKSSNNCLEKDSYIVDQRDGRIVQEVCLKLGHEQSGLLDLALEWQPGL